MNSIGRFFGNSDLRCNVLINDGVDILSELVETGGYKDVAAVVRSLIIVESPDGGLLEPLSKHMASKTAIKALAKLIREDSSSVKALQEQGISFLELAQVTNWNDELNNSPSIYALLVDGDEELQRIFLDAYDPRLGLDALAASKEAVGCSVDSKIYHCDLIVSLMDAHETQNDDRTILNYFSRCVPHLQKRANPIKPDLHWGVYLHPNATPALRNWIEENQTPVVGGYWGYEGDEGISVELEAIYDQPYSVLCHFAERGVNFDAQATLDSIAKVVGVQWDDFHKLGWLLSARPELLKDYLSQLAPKEQVDMLTFGATQRIPSRPTMCQQGAVKQAMVIANFLSLTEGNPSEELSDAIIEFEMEKYSHRHMSWALPLAIQTRPEFFLSSTEGKQRYWSAFQMAGAMVTALTLLTDSPPVINKHFDHAGVRVSMGKPSWKNVHGMYFELAERLEFKEFYSILKQYIDSVLERDIVPPANPDAAFDRTALIAHSVKNYPLDEQLRLVSLNLLDPGAEQAILCDPDVLELIDDCPNPSEIISKLSPMFRQSKLESDLGL